jgi:signal recognition particle subunit SRP54
MFDTLTDRFQEVFGSLRAEVRLTSEIVDKALGQIRRGLLEADVNFKVVKAFIARVRDRAIDQVVLKSLTPAQQVIGIVRDELLVLFGQEAPEFISKDHRPQIVMIFGLQGSGKTTTSAKLGRWFVGEGRHPLLVSTDVRRPAAIEQLNILGAAAGLRVHDPGDELDAVSRARSAVDEAKELGFDTVIIDTTGRLHIDDELMEELDQITKRVDSSDRLYIADAMTGQDAIKSAGEFHRRVGVTGIVLTKMDGDARGGAALSVVAVVGVPILFSGFGERVDDLEAFRPDRMVSRILGMGDVLTLIERAEQVVARDQLELVEQKTLRQRFTLEDLRGQMDVIKRMGPLGQLAGFIPGMSRLTGDSADLDSKRLSQITAIIDSMTRDERLRPAIVNGNRRRRIARGSGTSVEEVNRLLKEFSRIRKMLKKVQGVTGKRSKGSTRRNGRAAGPGIRHAARQMLQ